MTKTRTIHRCRECGATSARWLGRCPECAEWGSLEELPLANGAGAVLHDAERPVPVAEVDPLGAARRPTGLGELDRVLGGGLVAGSVTLLGGEPGTGKSTMMLQALGLMAERGARCLLVSAEESREQVGLRARRLGVSDPGVLVVSETSLPRILAHVDDVAPDVLAVDSVQTIVDPDTPGVPGSVGQVRECAHRLVRVAKQRGPSVLLVGHVTKEGTLAGPRALEHVVDTVLSFDGDRHHVLRLLRATKHRFGSTQEVGLFEMTGGGLVGVPDPSALLLADRPAGVPGSVVAPVLEGDRPLLVEVQALVARTSAPLPRRSAQGLDGGRVALLLAVLERRVDVPLSGFEVHASVAGGVRVTEAGADLAVALAVTGARLDATLPAGTVALGEVGLGGEVRRVPRADRRLAEAARLGFNRAVGPVSLPDVEGLSVLRVGTVRDAVAALGLTG
ncbi:MAG: DNA repair protein RadA [Acidimicrobiia bacterium]|nr:DNA repair protein RadA [Acidimicrobiia bacterium]